MLNSDHWGRRVSFAVIALSISCTVAVATPCMAQTVDQHLHPSHTISSDLPSSIFADSDLKPITGMDAASYALDHLSSRGVQNVVLCSATWIAAPLGGYLVDALGSWHLDGTLYSSFRVGVRDGTEASIGEHAAAGTEFVFLALGHNTENSSIWYPPPGPDHVLSEDEGYELLLPYEFLWDREGFENLSRRFQLPNDTDTGG